MDSNKPRMIKDALANDENTTDEEMVAYFIKEGLTEQEAKEWVAKRDFYAMNLVMIDDDGNDLGIYDPKSCTIKPIHLEKLRNGYNKED